MTAEPLSHRLKENHSGGPARQAALVLLFLLIGLAVGAIVSGVGSSSYRAEATLVVGPADGFLSVRTGSSVEPFTQTARNLLESDAVALHAAHAVPGATLKSVRDHLTVTSDAESSALALAYDDSGEARAVSTLGAVVSSFKSLVAERLTRAGGAPAMRVVDFVAPHSIGKVGPAWARNLGFGAAAGFLVGLALVYVLGLRREERYVYGFERELAARADGAAPVSQPGKEPVAG